MFQVHFVLVSLCISFQVYFNLFVDGLEIEYLYVQ